MEGGVDCPHGVFFQALEKIKAGGKFNEIATQYSEDKAR